MLAYEIGEREDIDTWRAVERPVPVLRDRQVLVAVRAVSLNFRDVLLATKNYGFPVAGPHIIPGSDGAGVVIETGPAVTRWKVGDRVVGTFVESWIGGRQPLDSFQTQRCGLLDGMLAQMVAMDQDGLVAIPEHLDFVEGSTLPVAGVTSWNALFGLRPLMPGETVLTLGTGGVSTFAIQFARAAGAQVISTSSSDEKLGKARALGAHDTINYRTHPEWQLEARRLTGGRGVDHVIDIGGKGTTSRAIASVRPGGIVSLLGASPGELLDPVSLLGTSAILRGMNVGSREMFEAMNAAITLHGIRPVIARTYAFEYAKEALLALTRGEHVGKIVVEVPPLAG
ncbi:NADPH:quinone oxidoreductase [Sphingomonas sp. Leaf231]|uniref:zinc-dependent alcohol dehydrogenase family protein n=1 Tax=Sphingomonas sp. Leaf231 TaxID=1736301 RepID=UPI0006F88C75|nr:NAD(P)-dependent alcohol dehydrogenase [Sphingomonas sp. Leaf231]KQN90139.1 NADPH:quinone oxidoreductase [Sphingomonas sp. Leaf231]